LDFDRRQLPFDSRVREGALELPPALAFGADLEIRAPGRRDRKSAGIRREIPQSDNLD
jgi:hypothetical protein